MVEEIFFSDIEKAVVDLLVARLGGSPGATTVVTKVPDPRPSRMVRVIRNDRKARLDVEDREGRRGAQLILDRPRVVFECTDDAGGAAELAATVRGIVNAAAQRSVLG